MVQLAYLLHVTETAKTENNLNIKHTNDLIYTMKMFASSNDKFHTIWFYVFHVKVAV